LWDRKSTRLIGYQPLDKHMKTVQNEFLHPQFMAGQILYMSHLEKIIANTYTNEYVAEAWIELLSLGFKSSHTNTTKTKARKGFPVMVTIDIPESYFGKEYYLLVADLLSLEQLVMPLGVYVKNPLVYMNEKSQGKVSRFTRLQTTANIKITTSYKKKILNTNLLDKVEQGYMDNLKILRDFSYNDKVVLDYTDIRKPHLPIFITNPPPGFILNKECKILVLYHYTHKNKGLKDFQQLYLQKRERNLRGANLIQNMNNAMKKTLTNSQDNFYFYINSLKDRIRERYTEAFTILEKSKE